MKKREPKPTKTQVKSKARMYVLGFLCIAMAVVSYFLTKVCCNFASTLTMSLATGLFAGFIVSAYYDQKSTDNAYLNAVIDRTISLEADVCSLFMQATTLHCISLEDLSCQYISIIERQRLFGSDYYGLDLRKPVPSYGDSEDECVQEIYDLMGKLGTPNATQQLRDDLRERIVNSLAVMKRQMSLNVKNVKGSKR